MLIQMEPIGIIRTPFHEGQKVPRQTIFARGIKGRVEIFEKYREGLTDLDGFSHILLLFYLDRAKFDKLMVHPPRDDSARGLFATRAPNRPNKIGLSVVKLLNVEKNILEIEEIDMLDKSPLLDIKPYIPHLDEKDNYRLGWLSDKY